MEAGRDDYGLKKFGVELEKARLHIKKLELEAEISLERLIDSQEAEQIALALGKNAPGCKVSLCARLRSGEDPTDNAGFFDMLRQSWEYYSPLMRPVLRFAKWERREDGVIAVRIPKRLYLAAKSYNGANRLEEFVYRLYDKSINVMLVGDESIELAMPERREEPVIINKQSRYADTPPWEDAPSNTKAERKPKKAAAAAKQAKPIVPQESIIMGRVFASTIMKMADVNEECETITVQGGIISIDVRERKNGGFIVQCYVTDKSNTLPVKLFPSADKKEIIDRLNEVKTAGGWIVVHGRYQRDEFSGTYCLFPDSIYKTEPVLRKDKAEEKRVELHLHTKMSAMDGFIDAAEAVKTAAKWGHKAVAITDHGVVQAFPAAVSAADKLKKKGIDIKVIMGVEGYLLPDCVWADPSGEYAAIELTRCNGALCAISAVKFDKNGEKGSFYTPLSVGVPMSAGFREETGISESDSENAPSLKDALIRLAGFIGEAKPVVWRGEEYYELYKEAKQRGVAIPGHIADAMILSRYHCRAPLDDTSTVEGCMAAMGNERASSRPIDGARAICAQFISILERYEAIGKSRIPLFDCVPRERIKGQRSTYHIIIIAKNLTGLKNLYKLVSYAHMDHLKGVPRIPRSLLDFYREGLIIGSACEAGELFRAVLENRPHEEICDIAREYDYLEIQPIGNNAFLVREGIVKDDNALRGLNKRIVELGAELGIPVAATGDAHFMEPEDAVFRAIVMSAREFKDAEQQAPLYFRTTDDMLREFSYLGEEKAREVVIDVPNSIAGMCESMKPFLSEKSTYAPKFPGANEELKGMCEKRAKEIYGEVLPPVVQARLDKELKSIIGNDYASLYLSAQRLVSKSLADGYLVGSRGSVGSSFVATMAGITEVNPLQPHYVCPNCKHSEFDVDLDKYACGVDMPDKNCPVCGTKYNKLGYTIPFEVFLGFKGDKTPDIDLNFSGDYQPQAHAYTEVMYGKGHAFRAGTISGLQDKTVYGYVKGYCEQHDAFFTRAETERLVAGCAGVKRTTGQHPGGIVIVPEGYEIFDFTPIQYPADKSEKNTVTTHFDFHAMDDRLVKLDILGHDDPTALRMLQDITGIDPKKLPLDDPDTMKIFSSIEPLGVTLEELGCDVGSIAIPEFGTSFVRQMLMDTRPTTMEELVRIAGLSHGTGVWLGNAQDLVLGGVATLSQVVCTRDDIMNYLISINMEPSKAFKIMESVRKGRGLTEEMEEDMRAVNTPEWFFSSCKKIGYMFPRAHAAAYVMMAFRIAWYKVHRPEAFYAVYFTVRADAFDVSMALGGEDKVLRNIKAIKDKGNKAEKKEQDLLVILEVVYEMNRRGIKLMNVDIYKSDATRFLIEDGALRPPFSAVAGVGTAAAESIGSADRSVPFNSIEDFRLRTKANSGVVDKLKELGCFDGMAESNQVSFF
ncbi:MAG TPA: PolC-type DNA polymerase III [Clostridia bacterium]|nr:PolC-type DNA polymerase III [Clostridia bacterium]